MGARGKLPKNKLPVVDYPTACAPVKPTKQDIERQRRFRAEDALRDMERVEGYKSDKELMKDVKTLAAEKVNNLKKIK